MVMWTTERVLELAPDTSSRKASEKLADTGKWSNCGAGSRAIWGECQGSGKLPYQTCIDFSGVAFKCSCPSRKFPCKHGLALFLRFVRGLVSDAQSSMPDWVSEWLDKRESTAEKKHIESKTPKDTKAEEHRIAQRNERTAEGLESLKLWLRDILHEGLASVKMRPRAFWLEQERRLVDAQVPGAAILLKKLATPCDDEQRWIRQSVYTIVQLNLLCSAFNHLSTLPEFIQADIENALGWPRKKEDILQLEGITDTWQVLGSIALEEGNLVTERTWIRGDTSGISALLLNFWHMKSPNAERAIVPTNGQFDAEVVFFPSEVVMRAIIKTEPDAMRPMESVPDGYTYCDDALEAYGDAIARQPWLPQFPVLLESVILMHVNTDKRSLYLVDSLRNCMPISKSSKIDYWQLLSRAGGHPITLFGEWDGFELNILNVFETPAGNQYGYV